MYYMLYENAKSSLKINYFFLQYYMKTSLITIKNGLVFFKKDASAFYFDAYYNLLCIKHCIIHGVKQSL